MVKWAGWIITAFGALHTIGALTVDHAARYAPVWFGAGLWSEDLAAMGPANSAFWLTFASFGPPTVTLGLIVLWMDRHSVTPPAFLGWILVAWTLLTATVLVLTPWPAMLLAAILLLVAGRRAARRGRTASRAA